MLTPRRQKIINALVAAHVKTAEPVSSKSLVKVAFPAVSSATIRNEMNELEKMGYLAHIHTSSGRVPTEKAYRFFVDALLATPSVYAPEATKKKIHNAISKAGNDPGELNKVVANLVSALSDNIVVTNIQDSDYFYKTGLSGLFESPEFREFDRFSSVANIFEHFEKMFQEMEKEFFGFTDSSVRVFIGKENSVKNIKNESVILAKYPLPGRKTGSMTIIGPTRMDYQKNIGLARCVVEEMKNISFVRE